MYTYSFLVGHVGRAGLCDYMLDDGVLPQQTMHQEVSGLLCCVLLWCVRVCFAWTRLQYFTPLPPINPPRTRYQVATAALRTLSTCTRRWALPPSSPSSPPPLSSPISSLIMASCGFLSSCFYSLPPRTSLWRFSASSMFYIHALAAADLLHSASCAPLRPFTVETSPPLRTCLLQSQKQLF